MIVLPINLKDDDYEGEKKWEQNINDDGTSSFKDVTEYKEKGSDFGATEVNKIHAGIMDLFQARPPLMMMVVFWKWMHGVIRKRPPSMMMAPFLRHYMMPMIPI